MADDYKLHWNDDGTLRVEWLTPEPERTDLEQYVHDQLSRAYTEAWHNEMVKLFGFGPPKPLHGIHV